MKSWPVDKGPSLNLCLLMCPGGMKPWPYWILRRAHLDAVYTLSDRE
jgi:hypothetical protein